MDWRLSVRNSKVHTLSVYKALQDTGQSLLGGSGVVISRVISPLRWVISKVTRLITTHEPPSSLSVPSNKNTAFSVAPLNPKS